MEKGLIDKIALHYIGCHGKVEQRLLAKYGPKDDLNST